MLRQHVMLALLTGLISSNCFAGNLPPWDKLPNDTRETVVRQYIAGFVAGMNRGVSEGIKSAIRYTGTLGSNTYVDSNQNMYTFCSNLIGNNIDRIYDETVGWQQLNVNNTSYYVNEITAFMKNNAKCGKYDVQELIELMAPIWFNLEKNVTYEDIAKNCGK